MFDSHCHLHDDRIVADANTLLASARARGVRGFLLAGVSHAGWQVEHSIAKAHPDVFVSYGVHPQLVAEEAVAPQLEALAAELAKPTLIRPVAIGEIGLDAFTKERRSCLPRQSEVFREQLALARAYDLPVILHILKTHEEAIAIMKKDGLPKAGGVVHSYSGSEALLAAYLPLGLHISLAGSITFKTAVKAPAVARVIPRDRLLVETDAPDQTPEPRRPALNEPRFLEDIVAAIAAIRGESAEEVAAYTTENAHRLFRIDESHAARP
jgi:TatD DNase family protein